MEKPAPRFCSVIPVPGELAEAYGFAFGGMLIVSVEEDSAAEAVGMAPGDLIYSVNGRKYAEEPYFIALGLAAAVCNMLGNWLGAGMAIKSGVKITRPIIIFVLLLLLLRVAGVY